MQTLLQLEARGGKGQQGWLGEDAEHPKRATGAGDHTGPSTSILTFPRLQPARQQWAGEGLALGNGPASGCTKHINLLVSSLNLPFLMLKTQRAP